MKPRRCLRPELLALAAVTWAAPAVAVPPLVIGDVPTADAGTLEAYAGAGFVRSGSNEWSAPGTELVLGVSSWQELTLEAPYLVEPGGRGLGDLVLGTKLLLLQEAGSKPGLAASVEWKLSNGSPAIGTGSGSMELGLLVRAQKALAWLTLIANCGYTFVSDARVGGIAVPHRNTGFVGAGGEADVGRGLSALADVYWRSSAVAGEPARAAGDVGLKARLTEHLAAHGAVGASLRSRALGGPDLRVYVGLKAEFEVF